MRLMIDGHLDLSWNALSWGRDITLDLDTLVPDHPSKPYDIKELTGDDDPA